MQLLGKCSNLHFSINGLLESVRAYLNESFKSCIKKRQVTWLSLKLFALFHVDIFRVTLRRYKPLFSVQHIFFFITFKSIIPLFDCEKTHYYLFIQRNGDASISRIRKLEALKQSLILVCWCVCQCLFACQSSKEKLYPFVKVDACPNFVSTTVTSKEALGTRLRFSM